MILLHFGSILWTKDFYVKLGWENATHAMFTWSGSTRVRSPSTPKIYELGLRHKVQDLSTRVRLPSTPKIYELGLKHRVQDSFARICLLSASQRYEEIQSTRHVWMSSFTCLGSEVRTLTNQGRTRVYNKMCTNQRRTRVL